MASLWTRPWPQKHAHENWDVKRANHTKYKPNRMSGTPSNRLLNILKNDRFKRPQMASDGLWTLFEVYLYFHFSPPCKISAQLDHFWSVKTGQIQRASNGLKWPLMTSKHCLRYKWFFILALHENFSPIGPFFGRLKNGHIQTASNGLKWPRMASNGLKTSFEVYLYFFPESVRKFSALFDHF